MQKGFFASLFDFSFSEFITIRIVRFLYMLSIIVAVLGTLVSIVSGFVADVTVGLLALVGSPITLFVIVVLARVYMELVIVTFRIAENTTRLVEAKQTSSSGQ